MIAVDPRLHDTTLVAIGGSAGGVEALLRLVALLPAASAASVVIAMHLVPNRPSLLPQLLAERCALPVREAEDKEPLAAGTVPVYLGAPNAAEFVPDGCYIDAASYRTPAELAAYLRHLAETPGDYQAYFAWRSRPLPDRLARRLDELDAPAWRRLAELVQRHAQQRSGRLSGRPSLPFGPISFLRTRLRRARADLGR